MLKISLPTSSQIIKLFQKNDDGTHISKPKNLWLDKILKKNDHGYII